MNNKHVKIGNSYNVDLAGVQTKVIVKSRKIEPKSLVVSFETVDADEPELEPRFVSAKHLSPLPETSLIPIN